MSEMKMVPIGEQSDDGVLEGVAIWRFRVRDAIAAGDEELLSAANSALAEFHSEAVKRALL